MKKHDSHNKPQLEHQFIISVKFLTSLNLHFLRCKVSIMISCRVLGRIRKLLVYSFQNRLLIRL